MGRYSNKISQQVPSTETTVAPVVASVAPVFPVGWPTEFPKPVIGLELEGVIIQDIGHPLTSPDQIQFIPGSLEAIKNLRLAGHRLMIITDQPGIRTGAKSQMQMDSILQSLMQSFGYAGIMSIDGCLYSTSDLKEDMFAKPNIGMFQRAATEGGIIWKGGWFVGHQQKDVEAAKKIGATPVIVRTGLWKSSKGKQPLIFDNLLEFSKTLL